MTAFRHSFALSPSLWSNLSSSRVRSSPLPILFLSVDIVISSSSIGYPDSSMEWRSDLAWSSLVPAACLSAVPASAVTLLGPLETGLKARMSVIAPVRSDELLRNGVTFSTFWPECTCSYTWNTSRPESDRCLEAHVETPPRRPLQYSGIPEVCCLSSGELDPVEQVSPRSAILTLLRSV